MSNIDHCFDNMFTNPKDSQGVSPTELILAQHTQAHMNRWWNKPLSLCRNLWQRTAMASFCTLGTSVLGREAFQSTFCGRGVGMPRGLAWHWKDPVTSNWKIFTQRRVSCLSLIMVCICMSRSGENRNWLCLKWWIIQRKLDLCGSQVRKG